MLVETCVARMQEELEARTDKNKVSPFVAKIDAAGDELRAFSEDRDTLELSYFKLAGSFHERQSSMVTSRSEPKPDTKKVKSADAIKPGLASLILSPKRTTSLQCASSSLQAAHPPASQPAGPQHPVSSLEW